MHKNGLSIAWYIRVALSVGIAAAIVGLPFLYYRMTYVKERRLRVVEPGKLYRAGRMTAAGFTETLQTYKIKTVINLMEEEQDPVMPQSYFDNTPVSEREVCEANGATMKFLFVDLTFRQEKDEKRPAGVDNFLEIMDNPDNYPVLLHCRAGLHRTGVLTAIYRMEYNGWTEAQAWRELRRMGFGEWNCFGDNDYIGQYVFGYQPGLRRPSELRNSAAATPRNRLIPKTLETFLPENPANSQ